MSVAALSVFEPPSDGFGVSGFIVQEDCSWDMVQLPVYELSVAMAIKNVDRSHLRELQDPCWLLFVRSTRSASENFNRRGRKLERPEFDAS